MFHYIFFSFITSLSLRIFWMFLFSQFFFFSKIFFFSLKFLAHEIDKACESNERWAQNNIVVEFAASSQQPVFQLSGMCACSC